LLAILDKTDERELEAASVGRVGFLQLDQQPGAYRGRVVRVSGVVRSAKLVAAPDNGFGIKEYYQLWLQPERNSPNLLVVYCLKLPADFPLGNELAEPAHATGFFFKRWAYQSQTGVTTAPLILARSVAWQPPPAPPPRQEPLGEQMVVSLIAAILLAALVLALFVVRGRRGGAPRRQADTRDVEAAMQLGKISPPDNPRHTAERESGP
jgi:hypothetical protein